MLKSPAPIHASIFTYQYTKNRFKGQLLAFDARKYLMAEPSPGIRLA